MFRTLSSLSQAKTLGGLGSLFILLSVVPTIGWLIGLAGFIMVLFAVKNISDVLSDTSIFNNMIISVISAIAGLVIAVLFVIASVLTFVGFGWMRSLGPNFGGFLETVPKGDIIALIVSIIVGLVLLWICLLISAIFLRKSYSAIGTKIKVGMFNTTALLYLIGAATTIIVMGFIILIVAEILQVIAFFSLPENVPPPTSPPSSTIPPPQ